MKNLLNIFNKTNKPSTIEIKNNTVVFWVGEDNQIYVKLLITDTSEDDAISLGDLFHKLNSGQCLRIMLDVLLDMSKQDSTINEYVKNVIASWQAFGEMSQSDDEPKIKPTAFNKS